MKEPSPSVANELGKLLIERKLFLTTAESCTGGHIASTLCAVEDTPHFYGTGFVTFNDDAKKKVLGVRPETIDRYTAVSGQTVTEMAAGALRLSGADASIAVSGYAGPEGGEDGTPAGTVWFAWQLPDTEIYIKSAHFKGDCQSVIVQAAEYALAGMLMLLGQSNPAGQSEG
ncbi:2-oxo-tetronate isomerase [Enterobacter sp. R1(2018)]|uniref:2-oxo-tetronate isomerase n=1 Tax=Enterobacter sp. R1(2018) TaxID=2447891 RepID=UPI000EAB97CE|nr:2-oxo-tetronate isomerase [Enterobacter sp. R1(2018)]RKQ38208.1 2-oxo-tetronate isomerase [Enterobacter sp. R1(2018)]